MLSSLTKFNTFFANDVYGIPLEEITGVVEYLMLPDEEPLVVRGKGLDMSGLKEKVFTQTSMHMPCEHPESRLPGERKRPGPRLAETRRDSDWHKPDSGEQGHRHERGQYTRWAERVGV